MFHNIRLSVSVSVNSVFLNFQLSHSSPHHAHVPSRVLTITNEVILLRGQMDDKAAALDAQVSSSQVRTFHFMWYSSVQEYEATYGWMMMYIDVDFVCFRCLMYAVDNIARHFRNVKELVASSSLFCLQILQSNLLLPLLLHSLIIQSSHFYKSMLMKLYCWSSLQSYSILLCTISFNFIPSN